MVFVIVWFLDYFTLEYVPSVNSIWIITSADLLHVWVTKFKTFFIFFKLSILTSNNVIWVGLFSIFFNEAQHVIKISMTGDVPVFYEVINLFIKPQNFLLMGLICCLKGLYLIIFFFNECDSVSNLPWLNCFQNPFHERFGLRLFTAQEKAIKPRFF